MHQTLHPPMTIRPDEVIRSGIIQPFSVRSMDPVTFARHEIDPFINAIRPMCPQSGGVTIDGASGLGIVSPEVIRSLSGFGQENGNGNANNIKLTFGIGGLAGGLILGALGAWLLLRK